MPYALGKLPPDPSKPRLLASRFLDVSAALTAPDRVDYLSRISSWPMYKNDSVGDCAIAAPAHTIQSLSLYGGGVEQRLTDSDVLNAYSAVSGFNPSTGAGDNGCVLQDVLNYWRKVGIGGHRILAFAQVDVHDRNEVNAAIAVFGSLQLGLNLPVSAQAQLERRQPWTPVAGRQGEAGSWGGHAVNVGFYDDPKNALACVTWGQVQLMSEAFWDKYVDEAWVVVSSEWLNAQGQSPTGVNLQGLGDALATITGQPNPFPPLSPTPAPSPTPSAGGDANADLAADRALASVARTWASTTRRGDSKVLRDAIQSWLKERGL